jgi:hypothetical protein
MVSTPGLLINCGTGNDASNETIADAKAPPYSKWCADSFVAYPF